MKIFLLILVFVFCTASRRMISLTMPYEPYGSQEKPYERDILTSKTSLREAYGSLMGDNEIPIVKIEIDRSRSP